MNYRIAPSYEKEGWKIVRIEGKKAQIENACSRCGGSGMYPSLEYNGICLRCNGSGKEYKVVKAYTESEYNAYVKNQEKTRKRKAEEEAQRIENLKLHSEENMKARLIEWGFDPNDPVMYVIVGENTYAIKDALKEKGCHFNKNIGWYSSHPINISDGYKEVAVSFLSCYTWQPFSEKFEIKTTAEKTVNEAIAKGIPPENVDWMGEIKERLRELPVTVTAAHSFETAYGHTTVYTFSKEGYIFTWFTSSSVDISVGDKGFLTGTVKDHTEYHGVKQTILTRCKFMEE